ncbi:hypothetical protein C8J56DRAFT_1170004, partial [Mycena floridula]
MSPDQEPFSVEEAEECIEPTDELQSESDAAKYIALNFNQYDPPERVVIKKEELVQMIGMSTPPIVGCENCLVRPGNGKEHSKCSACGITRYCSKSCQRANWPKHKASCQEVVNSKATSAKCRAEGKVFYDPMTLRSWFKNNHEACEYAAWHALELYKGPQESLFSTDLVVISLLQDPDAPNNPSKIKLQDICNMPRKELYESVRMRPDQIEVCEQAAERNLITVLLIDGVNATTMTQQIQARPQHCRKPEKKLWLGYVHLAVGGHIAKLAAELDAEKLTEEMN